MAKSPRVPAAAQPVARVLPFLDLSHLDREFDYLISEEDSEAARVGVRVQVPFHGRRVDGIIMERVDNTDYQGKLSYISRVISPEVVLPPRSQELIDAVATRYAGIRSEVIRLAVPPRVKAAEEADTTTPWEDLGEAEDPDLSEWARYEHGQSFVDAVLEGKKARAVWQVLPATSWADPLAALAAAVAKAGKGVLIVVPDQRDIDLLEKALRVHVGARQVTTLTAALGPQARYRRFLSILHGQARLVIGTRSAAFAPVKDLSLCVIVHDGDPSLVDVRAPYVHAREVLTTRSALEGASFIAAGFARTAEAQLLVESGWAHSVVPTVQALEACAPAIEAYEDSRMRMGQDALAQGSTIPGVVFKAVRAAFDAKHPVLFQIPRKGNAPVLACGSCGTPARCRHCNGPLELSASGRDDQGAYPVCKWCGRTYARHRCAECGSPRLRAVVAGHQRTAEELGRAFNSVRIIASGGGKIHESVPNAPAIVVATPGAQPWVDSGHYGLVVLADTWGMLQRPDLRATEETFEAWTNAAALAAPAAQGGRVIVLAPSELEVVRSFVSWDVVGRAAAELQARREVHFPPAAHLAAVDGPATALMEVLDLARLPQGAEVLGPVPLPVGVDLPGQFDERTFGVAERLVIRAPLGGRSQLGRALKDAAASWMLQGGSLPLRIQIDPVQVG